MNNLLRKACITLGGLALLASTAMATSQYSRVTGLSCGTCHTVFPRLNAYGENFLKNGYQSLESAHASGSTLGKKVINDNLSLGRVEDFLGFRVNLTPVSIKTNAVTHDTLGVKDETEYKIGDPNWIQFFVSGAIFDDVSFFVEMEYGTGGFKNNWFYFNFTNLGGTKWANIQAGNISPLEYASYPNRLPQLPALKSTVMQITNGEGNTNAQETNDLSSGRSGIQYYGYNDLALIYAGVSASSKLNTATNANDSWHYWGGIRFDMPEGIMDDMFEGTNLTIHYAAGTNTIAPFKATPVNGGVTKPGSESYVENNYTRISPQLNVRFDEDLDIQFAYVMGTDDNFAYSLTPVEVSYSGIALEANYLLMEKWFVGGHYDWWTSDDSYVKKIAGVDYNVKYLDPVKKYGSHRFVPQVTYLMMENMRISAYYEMDLRDTKASDNTEIKTSNTFFLNLRTMF